MVMEGGGGVAGTCARLWPCVSEGVVSGGGRKVGVYKELGSLYLSLYK